MIPSNNFSVLPWYGSLDEQNARRWWIYDRVYPLFVPANRLVPFQLLRDSLSSVQEYDGLQFTLTEEQRGWLMQDGTIQESAGGYGFYQELRPDEYASENPNAIFFYDLPARAEGTQIVEGSVSAIALDRYNTVLGVFAPEIQVGTTQDVGWVFPQGTDSILVQTNNNPQSQDECSVYVGTVDMTPVSTPVLYKADGTLVGNLPLTIGVENLGEKDCIIYFGEEFQNALPNGQYYLRMTDGTNTWYSEIFTAVNDIEPYLKITWWDEKNFVMDAGTIVYDGLFKNVLYLDSDLAKPEYPFEEEGETRDGYFFPVKQISEKRYRFAFFASEYLLDVMRFIRMADYAEIEWHGQKFPLDTFLITPEWEANGDVASVEASFDTATVAKKLGVGYIKATN